MNGLHYPDNLGASLPTDARERKAAPMAEGLLWYFPNALAEVARVSKAGNDQHNAGQPLHWARDKSGDHADCIIRHLVDAGTVDTDGQRHSAKVAWRALALLQEELEREHGLPLPRNARFDGETVYCGGCAPPVLAGPAQLRDAKIAYDVACDGRDDKATFTDDLMGYGVAFVRHTLENGKLSAAHIPARDIYLQPERIPKWDPAWGKAPNCDGLVARDIRVPHPMQAEAIREHDERLQGPEDAL